MNAHEPLWKSVAGDVCAKFGVSWADIAGRNRSHAVSLARAEFCGRCRAELGITSVALGQLLGRDHTTVMYLADKYLSQFDPYIAARHAEKCNRNRVNSAIISERKPPRRLRSKKPKQALHKKSSALKRWIEKKAHESAEGRAFYVKWRCRFNETMTAIVRNLDDRELSKGQRVMNVLGLNTSVLRCAWALHTGVWPDGFISRVNRYSRSLAPDNLKCKGVTAADVMQSKKRD